MTAQPAQSKPTRYSAAVRPVIVTGPRGGQSRQWEAVAEICDGYRFTGYSVSGGTFRAQWEAAQASASLAEKLTADHEARRAEDDNRTATAEEASDMTAPHTAGSRIVTAQGRTGTVQGRGYPSRKYGETYRVQFDSGETYDVPAENLTAEETPRDPRTHSVSGMFCPACDARIGVASKCERCGAAVSNGWTGQNEHAYPEATDKPAAAQAHSDGLSWPDQDDPEEDDGPHVTPEEIAAAEKAGYTVARTYNGGEDGRLWEVVTPDGSPLPASHDLAGGHLHRESAQWAAITAARENRYAVGVKLGRECLTPGDAWEGRRRAARAGNGVDRAYFLGTARGARSLAAQVRSRIANSARGEVVIPKVYGPSGSAACQAVSDILPSGWRAARAQSEGWPAGGPLWDVTVLSDAGPEYARPTGGREAANEPRWSLRVRTASGDAVIPSGNLKRDARRNAEEIARNGGFTSGERFCPVVSVRVEDGYGELRPDAWLPADIAASTRNVAAQVVTPAESPEAVSGVPVASDADAALRETWAQLRRDGSTRMTFEQYRACTAPREERAEMTNREAVALAARIIGDMAEGHEVSPGTLGVEWTREDVRRAADKLARMSAPISGGAPTPEEMAEAEKLAAARLTFEKANPEARARREERGRLYGRTLTDDVIEETCARIARESAGAAVAEIRRTWDDDNVSPGEAEEALRRAGDIARDLPEEERVRFLRRLPVSLLEPLADFGPFEIEEACRLAASQEADLSAISQAVLDFREIEAGPSGAGVWEALRRNADYLTGLLNSAPAEIVQDVPTSTLHIVSRYGGGEDGREVAGHVWREIEARDAAEGQYVSPVSAEQLNPRESRGPRPGETREWTADKLEVLGLARLAPQAAQALRTLASIAFVEGWTVYRDADDLTVGVDCRPVGQRGPVVCAWIGSDGRTRLHSA